MLVMTTYATFVKQKKVVEMAHVITKLTKIIEEKD